MKIAVIAAMEEEIGPLRAKAILLSKVQIGKVIIEEALLNDKEILLVEGGIGKVNAAIATTILIERFSPELIINIGSAGAFDKSLKIGDVVIATEYRYGDVDVTCFGYEKGQVPQMPANYLVEKKWLDAAYNAAKSVSVPYSVDFGLILTLDSFMSNRERVFQVYRDFPETKVSDMEGLAVVQAADQYGIPVIGIRAVSDVAGKEEASANSFDNNLEVAADTSSSFMEILFNKLF